MLAEIRRFAMNQFAIVNLPYAGLPYAPVHHMPVCRSQFAIWAVRHEPVWTMSESSSWFVVVVRLGCSMSLQFDEFVVCNLTSSLGEPAHGELARVCGELENGETTDIIFMLPVFHPGCKKNQQGIASIRVKKILLWP